MFDYDEAGNDYIGGTAIGVPVFACHMTCAEIGRILNSPPTKVSERKAQEITTRRFTNTDMPLVKAGEKLGATISLMAWFQEGESFAFDS